MEKRTFQLVVLCLLLCMSSCRSSRNLVYLKDIKGHELQRGLPVAIPEYLIKTNDNLYVNIQSLNPEVNKLFNPSQGIGFESGTQQMYGQLSGQYLNGYHVNAEGDIKLPVLGNISVAGLSIPVAQERIQAKADEYLKEATVKLKLLSYKVTVMGEVSSPGVYYNYNNSLTVLEAISMANGITDYARIKKVLVMRPTDKGSETFRIDLSSKNLLASEAFFLLPNDVVYVEPHRHKNTQLNSSIYSLLLSAITTVILVLDYVDF
ncbi:MAG: polysaccharide biosynthesis/export family protein [Marinifilaceae bacterium]